MNSLSAQSSFVLRLLTASYIAEKRYQAVAEICDERDVTREMGRVSVHCGISYAQVGRDEDAVQAYLSATSDPSSRTGAHENLAKHYLRRGRRDEAREHLEMAIGAEPDPAMRAYRLGYMILQMHPTERDWLLKARAQFERALQLQPNLQVAHEWLGEVNSILGE